MSALKLRSPALMAFALLTLSRGALAQSKAPVPPELPAPATAPAPAQDKASPATGAAGSADPGVAPEESASPANASGRPREMESDRGALSTPRGGEAPPARVLLPVGTDIEPLVEQPEPAPQPQPAGPPHKQRISLGLGFRGGVVADAGYDPYSTSNTLPMVSLHGSFTPWPTRPVAFSLVAEWDYGGSDATARGLPSSFDMHRFAIGLESRYQPITRMAFFARVVPAVLRAGASVEDPYLSRKLEASSWTWGVDVTGGAAARVGAVGTNEAPKVSFWLALDMGYRFAGATSMRFRPGDLTEEDQTRRFGEIPLTDLDLSGFIGRLSFSVSF